jgi:hypothetical protein
MLKNFRSLFIVSDENAATPGSETQTTNQTVELVQKPDQKFQSLAGNVDNDILGKLFQALEDNNQQGFDYMEFRKALKTLSALPIDESIKYQSTFATASTIGVTLEMLLSSIEFYKKVLINEEANFTKAIKDQTSVNISDKITEKENVLKSIVAKGEQIKKLTNEIGALQTEIEQLTLSIETAESKIKETALNFESSINVIKNQLDQDAIKLKQYIK